MSSRSVRLPALPKLAVKDAVVKKKSNQCVVLMSTLLNCWASNGEGNQVCSALEGQLKKCMDSRKPEPEKISPINYHAARLYPKISGKPHD